jgi:hypothetical protein
MLKQDESSGMQVQKGDTTCFVFVNVRVNGSLELAEEVKIRDFDTFSTRKSRVGGYRVSHGITLETSSTPTTQQEHATRAATHGTGGCECSTKWKAPDDGHKSARNMESRIRDNKNFFFKDFKKTIVHLGSYLLLLSLMHRTMNLKSPGFT